MLSKKTIKILNYIVKNNASSERAAKHFKIKPCTVYYHINKVKVSDPEYYALVSDALRQSKKPVKKRYYHKKKLPSPTLTTNYHNATVDKVLDLSDWLLDNQETLTNASKHFGRCISTIYRYIHIVLPEIDQRKYAQVVTLLNKNKNRWNIR